MKDFELERERNTMLKAKLQDMEIKRQSSHSFRNHEQKDSQAKDFDMDKLKSEFEQISKMSLACANVDDQRKGLGLDQRVDCLRAFFRFVFFILCYFNCCR